MATVQRVGKPRVLRAETFICHLVLKGNPGDFTILPKIGPGHAQDSIGVPPVNHQTWNVLKAVANPNASRLRIKLLAEPYHGLRGGVHPRAGAADTGALIIDTTDNNTITIPDIEFVDDEI